MLLRFSLLLLLPFSSVAVMAQVPLGPAPFCGVPTFRASNPLGASATVWRNQAVIVIDHSQFSSPFWLHFVIAHECAHHVLGHTLPNGMWFRQTNHWATASQELGADCWAARTVHSQAALFAYRHFLQQGNSSGGPGYPTGYQRAENIRRCAGF